VGTAASASAVLSYFVLTHVTAGTNITVRRLAAEAASKAASQARWLAKPENQNYFRGPVNVAWVQAWRAPHAIAAIGARVDLPALRYKMSQWRNPLVPLSKQPLRRGRRYKMSVTGRWPRSSVLRAATAPGPAAALSPAGTEVPSPVCSSEWQSAGVEALISWAAGSAQKP
jgi:hypothetical protein